MKGKGEVKGWITRHGVHVPIYGDYTVREGVEPKAKSAKVKSGKSANGKDSSSKGKRVPSEGATKDVDGKKSSTDEHYDTKLNSIRDRMRSGEITHEQARDEAFEYEKSQRSNKNWSDVDRNRMESKVRDIFSEAGDYEKNRQAKNETFKKAYDAYAQTSEGKKQIATVQKIHEEDERLSGETAKQDSFSASMNERSRLRGRIGAEKKAQSTTDSRLKAQLAQETKLKSIETEYTAKRDALRQAGDEREARRTMDEYLRRRDAARRNPTTISEDEHIPAPRYVTSADKKAKTVLPTSVRGLQEAYEGASGGDKTRIRAELRKKGYTLVGGKWVKK